MDPWLSNLPFFRNGSGPSADFGFERKSTGLPELPGEPHLVYADMQVI